MMTNIINFCHVINAATSTNQMLLNTNSPKCVALTSLGFLKEYTVHLSSSREEVTKTVLHVTNIAHKVSNQQQIHVQLISI